MLFFLVISDDNSQICKLFSPISIQKSSQKISENKKQLTYIMDRIADWQGCLHSDDTMATQSVVEEGDFDLLSTIYDIIKSVEKEQQDNAQKLKDSQEAGQKVLELQRKLDHAREVVRKLPGIELSKDEQLLQIDLLRRQLTLKRDLLNKYRSITSFDRETQQEFQIHQH